MNQLNSDIQMLLMASIDMVVTYLSNTSSEKPGSISKLTGLEVVKVLTDTKGLQQGAMIGGYTLW